MTETDKQHGYSYESRYSILGMLTWDQLEAQNLPGWALPSDHERFSIAELPQHRSQLRL
jgi:hypothetical protein